MVPRVLLLTGVAPGRVNVGRIFLRDLCLLYPRDRIFCFCLEVLPESARSSELQWLPITYTKAPPEHGLRRYGENIARFSRPIIEKLYVELTQLPRLIDQAVKFGKSHKVDLVWATLHSPTTLRIARVVAELLNVPLVTTVWDPPTYKLRQYNLDRYTRAQLLASFDSTLRSAVRSGVASEGMKRRYEGGYGTDCVVMIHGQQQQIKAVATPAQSGDEPLVIGYAGSIYAVEEWNALLAALASRNWQVGGRQVVIRVLSSYLDQHASIPLQIEFLGWRDPVEAMQILSQADVAYLPYWFDDAYQDTVQLTFPNKLATYVAARVPVLFHGPLHSSPTLFFERFPVGSACHSLDHDEIICSLEQLVTDRAFYSRAKLACDDAFDQELNAWIFRDRFSQLIGVEEDDLLPLPQRNPLS